MYEFIILDFVSGAGHETKREATTPRRLQALVEGSGSPILSTGFGLRINWFWSRINRFWFADQLVLVADQLVLVADKLVWLP
jgi:hypothetical protein